MSSSSKNDFTSIGTSIDITWQNSRDRKGLRVTHSIGSLKKYKKIRTTTRLLHKERRHGSEYFEEEYNHSSIKPELVEKHHNICFGTKIRPIWESRTLKINPVDPNDLSRFLKNAQHTQRFAILSQVWYICWNTFNRLPFLWSIIMVFIEALILNLCIPDVPKRSWYSTGLPLLISILVSIFSNVLEAKRRYIIGRCVDYKKCTVLHGRKAKIRSTRVSDLVVGNIVKLSLDEEVPADIIILASSNSDGKIHIDTSSIDGSNNLKVKTSVKGAKVEASIRSFANLRGHIVCNKPSSDMDVFSGTLYLKGHPRPSNITIDNFVMKGSIIRNTTYLYGVVVFTGPDTKLAQNTTHTLKQIKLGSFEHIINKFSIILALLYFICLFSSVITRSSNIMTREHPLTKGVSVPIESIPFVIFRFIILYGCLMPITLPAIMDLLRLSFAPFYDGVCISECLQNKDLKPGKELPKRLETKANSLEFDDDAQDGPKSWSLNSSLFEDLGMVDFIFTDKTGTLTSNNLSITLITFGKKTYRVEEAIDRFKDDVERDLGDNPNFDLFVRLMCMCNSSYQVTNMPPFSSIRSFVTTNLFTSKLMGSGSYERLKKHNTVGFSKKGTRFGSVFFIEPEGTTSSKSESIAIMGSARFEDSDSKSRGSSGSSISVGSYGFSQTTSKIDPNEASHKYTRSSRTKSFKSTSQEDECMTALAMELGYCLMSRSKSSINVNIKGTIETVDIIGINEFSSTRKRMSIVLRQEYDGNSIVFVKGDGESMLNLLDLNRHKGDIETLRNRIKKQGLFGYRVLVCAYRRLDKEETIVYQRHYADLEGSIYGREERFESCAKLVENNLIYLGLVAFKDEIQPEVIDTIDMIMDSGTRIWMVTGDSKGPSIESAYLSKLLVPPCRIFHAKLEGTDANDSLNKRSTDLYNKFIQERPSGINTEQLCLVVEGTDLKTFLSTPDMQTCFVNMACSADVVIACGLTPIQKGELVKLVKLRLVPTPITLAIGDGLNDVKMIEEAHVGVGIINSTSPHAASYADFAVTSFASLKQLLFLQGTITLQAMSIVVYWSYFKSLCFVMPLFYYQGYTNWAGLDLYGSFIQLLFQIVFTPIPVVTCALFYKQIPNELLVNLPVFYTLGRRRYYTSLLKFCFWALEGIIMSLFCYYSLRISVVQAPMIYGGNTLSARAFGLLCSLGSLIISNSRLIIEFAPRTYLVSIPLAIIFVLGVIPIFLSLTYALAGRSLKAATMQVVLWKPFYILVPLWFVSSIVSYTVSSILQAFVSPNLSEYIVNWFSAQKCDCNSDNDSSKQRFRFKVIKWCSHVLERAKNEFNIHESSKVNGIIPAARPFKIREGAVSLDETPPYIKVKDNMERNDDDKNDKTVNHRISNLINKLTLRFQDMQLEADYLFYKTQNHYYENSKWYLAIYFLLGVFYFLDFIVDYKLRVHWGDRSSKWFMGLTIVMELLILCCILFMFKAKTFAKHVNLILGSLVFCMILQHAANRFILDSTTWIHPVLFPIFTFVILRIPFVYSVPSNVIFFTITLGSLGSSLHSIPLFIGIIVFVGFVGYRLEYDSRKSFILESSVANARKKQSELLNTMLPNFVVSKMINARLNEDGIPIGFEAESHGAVSILFCDVYNFPDLIANVEPTRLIELLDSLFLAFDRCVEQFNATKIETVSESYLTAFGLDDSCPYTSAANAIDMSLAMLEVAHQIRYPLINKTDNDPSRSGSLSIDGLSESMPVKIGINSGGVISGLVGAKKPQYALFGDTVNTASRMKSTGEVGHVHISESTYELIKSDETLQFEQKDTFVKGKGTMKTYLLKSVLGSSYPGFDGPKIIHEVDAFSPEFSKHIAGLNFDHFNNDPSESIEADYTNWGENNISVNPSLVEKMKNRRVKISAAIGASLEEDLDDEYMGSVREFGSYSFSSSSSSVYRGISRCLPFRKNNTSRSSSTITLIREASKLDCQYDNLIYEEHDRFMKKDQENHMKRHELLLLKFSDKLQEDRYRLNFYNNATNLNTNEHALVIFLMTFVAQSVIALSLPRIYTDAANVTHLIYIKYIPYWSTRSVFTVVAFMLWLVFHYRCFSKSTESSGTRFLTFCINTLFVTAACVFALSNSWAVSGEGEKIDTWLTSDTIEFYFYIVVLHHSTGMLFHTCLLVDILFMILSMTFISTSVKRTPVSVIALFTIPCCIIFNLISAHCKEAIDRKTFYTNEKARAIEARVSQMLNEMLPKSILEEFRNDKLKMTYIHENMSFLFSDIVGFTSWATSVDASEVIALLQKLFANFDRNTTQFGLYKLCTIGDAYVAVSEPATEPTNEQTIINDIEGVLQMASSMLRIIKELRETFNIPGLNMRIGLHFGTSIGGVIGSGRLRYDLWGMDIYTANKIESHGVPGMICVSERLKDIMYTIFPNRFTFKFNTEIQVINETVNSYIIVGDNSEH
ncbi:guanylyl cyclase, putative [Theileria equi strain WA]|uniref:Guanylyl cyclase, putative n=1 Tax=Theileria equi strain WA TaxID=1537102 RepID=L1LDN9_THEEQ|nr:guanylyl cyclase, putative [Theileria equi strain WA]EKX73567.1 guanylyl cyclase, putative [Theileria equi strain WA]|eukprot:XP_004833019.1 guanylyl cyclase, putative [Theileria equi strain WA]